MFKRQIMEMVKASAEKDGNVELLGYALKWLGKSIWYNIMNDAAAYHAGYGLKVPWMVLNIGRLWRKYGF